MMIRRAGERGFADHGWLRSFHSFSFADYYDPRFMGFRSLRVINEDRVAPGKGFGTHSHRDMEIISYVLEGALEHKDSLGTGSIIRPGDVQRMSAGTGVAHSEYNASQTELVHFLQIWIMPAAQGIAPSYEQKAFPLEERTGKLRLVGSNDGREGSLTIHQDVNLYAGVLGTDVVRFQAPRATWIQVARGDLWVGETSLSAGDAVAIDQPQLLELRAKDSAEVLLFDLA